MNAATDEAWWASYRAGVDVDDLRRDDGTTRIGVRYLWRVLQVHLRGVALERARAAIFVHRDYYVDDDGRDVCDVETVVLSVEPTGEVVRLNWWRFLAMWMRKKFARAPSLPAARAIRGAS